MKNTSLTPYIYKVTNLETGQYYIGSQCSGKIIGMNYFTSSTNRAFKDDFKNRGEEKYKIEIIKEFEDPKECNRVENYIIRNYMQKKDGLCLNRAYHCNGEKIFSRVGQSPWNKGIPSPKKGIPLSEAVKQKMSIAKKGHPNPHKGIPSPKKGIPLSEATKQKISTSKKGHPGWNKGIHPSEETRKKMSESRKGIHHSEETKRKMSIAHKGQPPWNKGGYHSEETRKKISASKKGHPSPRRIKISIENTVFSSLKEASKYYNVSITVINRWLKTGNHNAFYIEK